MCGRYVSPDEAALERYWHIGARNSGRWIRTVYNTSPTMHVPMVLLEDQGRQEVQAARWGLIPFWWKKEKPPTFSFNARSEEAAAKPMWRQSLRSHRCLIPAVGWYEWSEHERTRNRSGREVGQPYYHYPRGGGLLAIAGLWSTWTGLEGQEVTSCALLTKEAAPSIAEIHHRMPVILHPEQSHLWLSPYTSMEQVHGAIAFSREDFSAYPVSPDVGDTRNEGPQLIEPLIL